MSQKKSYHKHLEARLEGIRQGLLGEYRSGSAMSNSSRGDERETFVRQFLQRIFPPIYRFGKGDITDIHEERTGQLDLVAEYPLMCSFPASESGPRLFLAESVAFVIEVKSNLALQWNEVLATASKVKKIRRWFERDDKLRSSKMFEAAAQTREGTEREFLTTVAVAQRREAKKLPIGPGERIPVYAVGFSGWKQASTLEAKLEAAFVNGIQLVDGAYVLDSARFRKAHQGKLQQTSTGPQAMLTFIDALEWHFMQEVVPLRLAWTYSVCTRRELLEGPPKSE